MYRIPMTINYKTNADLDEADNLRVLKILDEAETDPYGWATDIILVTLSMALEYEGAMNDHEESILNAVRELIHPLPNPNLTAGDG